MTDRELMQQSFERITGVAGAWTNPALMQARNGFIQGWEAARLAQHDSVAVDRDAVLRMAQEAGLVRFEGGELEAYGIAKASLDDHSRAYWQVATEQRLKHFADLVQERVVHGDDK
jgi:hypothetical protein